MPITRHFFFIIPKKNTTFATDNMKTKVYILLLLMICCMACREDIVIYPSETDDVAGVVRDTLGPSGMYVLCEGNMGSNKASLDFMDFRQGKYTTNLYGARNPHVVKDLGDVGNDIAIYGNRLYAVINCSHKVEVMDKNTGVRIGQVDIPNCRYIAFANGKAYVSSYVAPVSLDPQAERGAVFEFDTATLQVTNRVAVGYQPEQLVIQGERLYVANSGGYRAPDYDSTLSVIHVPTLTEMRRIPLGVNLHNVAIDSEGKLWVTSRGDKAGTIASRLFVLQNEEPLKVLDISASAMHICGDSLYFVASQQREDQTSKDIAFGIIHTKTLEVVSTKFITDGTEAEIAIPYAVSVNPHTRDIYVTDAENYVSSGMLYCFSPQGKCRWKQRTGDIPAHLCFLYGDYQDSPTTPPQEGSTGAFLHEVLEYCPAPGQFINKMPLYEAGNTAEDMVRKCTEALAANRRGMVSLGGFGGYLTFRFEQAVRNIPDAPDFQIFGNSFAGTSEPGIVQVSVDANKNGLPDDVWYELAGSEYKADSTTHGYQLTYTYGDSILWQDNKGGCGYIIRNPFHTQDYFPQWLPRTLSFPRDNEGMNGLTLLASHTTLRGTVWHQEALAWGYVDNHPNTDEAGNSFDIAWAVDATGEPIALEQIDFIRVYTAVHESYSPIGELSTEITGAVNLSVQAQ